MATIPSTCNINDIECFVTGYQVQVEAGEATADGDATLAFTFLKGCNFLKDHCRIREVISLVVKQFLADASVEASIYQDCCDRCACQLLSGDFTYYGSMYQMVFVTTAPAPAAPVVYNVFTGRECVVELDA